jgi:molybdopterin-containing oxidoreductase family iron-sulfur binding subunit
MESKENDKTKNRRSFLKKGLALGAGALTGGSMLHSCTPKKDGSVSLVKLLTTDGKLVEVSEDQIKEASSGPDYDVRKGDPSKEFVMVIDLAKCRNARKCIESCQQMHSLPAEDEWIRVFLMQDSDDTAPYWFPKPCFHCNSPSCVNVCPVGATFKRLDGLVLIDNDRCIGCKFCMTACPYSSRTFNWSEKPEEVAKNAHSGHDHGHDHSTETSYPQVPGTVGKCDFCPDMAYKGILPHCIDSCPNGVIYFGDKKEDVVTNGVETVRFSQLIYDRAGYRYMEELGTRPSVYYLPPVNRLFAPEKGLEDLPEDVKSRYKHERSHIKKEVS